MRKRSVGVRAWARLLGLEQTVVEAVGEQDGAIVISVRPVWSQRDRCPHCRRRCPGYDLGEGRRRWRALDLATTSCFLEADAPRVECNVHGVVVAAVPWARHDAGFTRSFDDTAAWLAVNTSKSAICQLSRIAWRTVGRICERVSAEANAGRDLFANLTELGFDEISIRKGQKYLTVVVDHHTGRLVWAFGRDRKTVEKFLDLLGPERCQQIRPVSCDDAEWITRPIAERCPKAVVCLDPWHIVKAATDALDDVRRQVWNEARRAGNKELAKRLKGARFALWKKPEKLTDQQHAKLAWIQTLNAPIYRAYPLKEQLRGIYHADNTEHALALLDGWLKWARRCRLEPFVKLAKRITEQRSRVEAAPHHSLSNARVEQVNTQIRLIIRRGFGYRSPGAVIALAMLSLGGLCPPLPRR